jgi:hypothetical protein
MAELDQARIDHLHMIQGVITRMAANSFALKTLAVALSAAVLAYTGAVADPSPIIVLAALLPLVMFWGLDAQYLRLERLFRRHYDAVRRDEVQEPFTMDIGPYQQAEQHLFRIAFSWSVVIFYAPIAIVLFVLWGILAN